MITVIIQNTYSRQKNHLYNKHRFQKKKKIKGAKEELKNSH